MISLIVVNYHAAGHAERCIRSARAASRQPLEVIVVDNSVDEAEAERLRPLADHFAAPRENAGYAAAINIGRRLAGGEVLLVSNPDVLFGAASIDPLRAALQEGVAVAGPALFWDDEYRWLLPPAEVTTTSSRLGAALATRSRAWARWRDRRRILHRIRFWQTLDNLDVPAVSGAVMAIRTRDFDSVGGFDERYRLYFEEIDFMRRVAAAGRRIVYVPASRCRHLYNQSAGSDPGMAGVLFAESERKYHERWTAARGMIDALAGESLTERLPPVSRGEAIEIDLDDALVEASPLPGFETAAGHFPRRGELDLPPSILEAYRGERLYLRVVDCAKVTVQKELVIDTRRPALSTRI